MRDEDVYKADCTNFVSDCYAYLRVYQYLELFQWLPIIVWNAQPSYCICYWYGIIRK